MADGPNLHGVYEKLGEMTATLREVSHTGRNNSQKIDALAEVVIKQGALADRVEALYNGHETHHQRITVLEVEKHHRDGAIGLFEWTSKHWPFVIAIVSLAVWIGVANGVMGR